MKAVILTAGEGMRIRPLTKNMTKGMIPIANKPILEHIINALKNVGITDIIMIVGYKKERILSYFGDGKDFDVKLTFVEQKKQLGTAHALIQARHILNEDFLLLPGDNYIEGKTLQGLFGEDAISNQVIVTESRAPSKYGVVTLKKGNIIDIKVTPRTSEDPHRFGIQSILTHSMSQTEIRGSSDIIFTCICHLAPDIFDYLEDMKEVERNNMTGLIRYMIGAGIPIKGIKTDLWLDAVYPWDLLFLNNKALNRLEPANEGNVEPGAYLLGNVSIGKGTVIRSNCYIQGPVIIGEGCDIGPNACIFPSTSIGDNVVVDAFTKISNSILMDDVSVAMGSLIQNSVLAAGVKCGPNCSTQTADVEVGPKERIGWTKRIGCVIGEDSVLGNGAVIDGGLIVGAGCDIGPLVHLRKNAADGYHVIQ